MYEYTNCIYFSLNPNVSRIHQIFGRFSFKWADAVLDWVTCDERSQW